MPAKKAQQKPKYAEIVPLRGKSPAELLKISEQGLLSLNMLEMQTIQRHFEKLERDPTDVELECLAQTWSEHCKHKVFNSRIFFRGEDREEFIDNLFKQTIVAATEEVRKLKGAKDCCVSVFSDNAGVVRFDDDWNLAFKVETHNHPSALDPYAGANTGIGGVIRDPLGTGLGATPIFNTDVFCFAPPDYDHAKLPEGVLHPRRIFKGVTAGVRDYGNRMGIPTINGSIHFDDRYLGNPLVYCGTAGLIPKNRMTKRPRPGDLVVTVGGRTGRDGIHGATFSSLELTRDSETTSGGAVQIGNPIEEKKAMDVILQARDLNLYDSITDCGAGGFSSAVGEMGEDLGVDLELEKAPLKYEGLKAWEILLSEAQERMVLSVPPRNLNRFLALCKRENVEAAVIGRFARHKRFRVTFNGETVGDLDMAFLHKGTPRVLREARWTAPALAEPDFPEPANLTRELKRLLRSWNVASKEWVIRQYDHEVQGTSAIKPLQGADRDGPGDASVVAPVLGSTRGVAVSNGICIRVGDIDPYKMAAGAVDEAMRNLAAVGADPDQTAILDNFCWGNPDRQERLGALVRAAYGCRDAAVGFRVPFISGKDSFYNEYSDGERTIAIPYTLLVSAVGIVPDVRKCVTMDLKEAGNFLYVLGETRNELGGSQYYRNKGHLGANAPGVDFAEAAERLRRLYKAIRGGLVRACHDCSDGGLGVAAAEMAFAGGLGLELSLQKVPAEKGMNRNDSVLFSESHSRMLVETTPEAAEKFEELFAGDACARIGTARDDGRFVVKGLDGSDAVEATARSLKSAWKKPFDWK